MQTHGRALLLTAHLGNWEVLALIERLLGFPTSVVVRPLDAPWLDALADRWRRRTGIEVIDKRGALKPVLTAIRRGRLVALLLDQNTTRRESVFVSFFGRPASTSKSLAVLAVRTRTPVVPVFIYRVAYRTAPGGGPSGPVAGCRAGQRAGGRRAHAALYDGDRVRDRRGPGSVAVGPQSLEDAPPPPGRPVRDPQGRAGPRGARGGASDAAQAAGFDADPIGPPLRRASIGSVAGRMYEELASGRETPDSAAHWRRGVRSYRVRRTS